MQEENKLHIGILLLPILLFFSIFSYAQSHIGKVTSKLSGNDLNRVKVTIRREGKNVEEVNTNSEGIFKVEDAKRGDSIKFELENYQTIFSYISQNKIIVSLDTLIISEKLVDPFDQTLSSAGKKDRSIVDIPASVVLITKDEIRSLGYQSVEEILVNVPGLYGIEEHDWTGSGMNIGARGFYSPGFNNEMVILVNGVNMLEDHMSAYPLARLEVPIESIERIEVIRGPMSVVYGSGAFLGSINIITDVKSDDDNYKVSGVVSLGKGIERDLRTTAVIEANTQLGHQSLSFGRSNFAGPSMNYRDITSDTLIPDINTTNQFTSQRTFVNYSGNFGKFRTNVLYSQAYKGYNTIGMDAVNLRHNAQLSGGNAQISYLDQFFKDSLLVFQAKIGYFSHRNIQDYYTDTSEKISGFHSNAIETEVNGIWLLDRSKFNLPIEITTGFYYRRAFGLYSFYEETKGYSLVDSKENYGCLINTFYDFTPNRRKQRSPHQFQLVAGVRMEYIPQYDIEITDTLNRINTFNAPPIFIPRAGLIYRLNEKNIFKLLYGQGIKQPTFVNISENTNLSESRLGSFEINYLNTILPKDVNKRWRNDINVSLFYNSLNGLIERFSIYLPETKDYDYSSSNLGQIKTFGLEFSNTFKYKDKLRLSVSYTFQKSNNFTPYISSSKVVAGKYSNTNIQDTSILENVEYSPVSLGYANLIWKISNSFEIGVKARYVGSMFSKFQTGLIDSSPPEVFEEYAAPQVGDEEIAQGYNNIIREAPGYFIFDAQVSVTNIFKSRFRIDLNVKNILNKEFRIPYTGNNSWADRGLMGRGRWFILSAKYYF